MHPADDFPALYHAHHSRQLEDLSFWLRLAQRYGSPILELGCGTGRIFSPLFQAGYPITGLDNDRAMLDFICCGWEEKNRPALIHADMTTFHLAQVFHLVLLPCNTFSTLTAVQQRQTLVCIRHCLIRSGVFATSLPNPQLLKRLPKESAAEVEEIFPHPADGEPVQVSSAWRRTRATFQLEWHYDHLLPDGRVERISARLNHSLENVNVFIQEFHQAGFSEIEIFGDFDESPYTDHSPNLILVAK